MKWELASKDDHHITYVANVIQIGCLVMVYAGMGGSAVAMQFLPGVRWDATTRELVAIPPPTDNFSYNMPPNAF